MTLVTIIFTDIMRLNVHFVSRTALINDFFKLIFLNSLHSESISFEDVVLFVKSTFNVAAEQRRETRAFTR